MEIPSPEKPIFHGVKLEQPGPIDYVIHLLYDSESQQPFLEFVTRETGSECRTARRTSPLSSVAPAEDNDAFTTTEEITIQFEVPGNPLPLPQNITAIDRNGTLEVQWSPITSNPGDVSYMIDVKTGQTLEDLFGNFVQKEARIKIPDAKPYGRFSFTIKCFPDAGNYSDLWSLLLPILLTSRSFTVPLLPKIKYHGPATNHLLLQISR